jgi:hypothetical protein
MYENHENCVSWQCEQSRGPDRLPQSEVFKQDKLRGGGQGTGDALWKNAAKVRLKAHFEERAKDERINALSAQVAQARRKAAPPPRPRPDPPSPYFGRSNTLAPVDPPVAALLPTRTGSPGTFGVRNQMEQHGRQFQRLLQAQGVAARAPRVTRTGVPESFHDPPTLSVSASHQELMRARPWRHMDTPTARDYRSLAEFTASWKPTVPQRRVHTVRDLA